MTAQEASLVEQQQYAELRRVILQAVRSSVPGWLAQDAEDIAQNAVLKVHRKLQQNPEAALNRTYLKRVAHSVLVDEIRHRRRRFEGHQEDAEGEDFEVPDERRRPEPQGLGDALQDCLLKQQQRRRRALTLHLLGHNAVEVAELTGVKTKVADNLIYRALASLRDCLRQKEVYP